MALGMIFSSIYGCAGSRQSYSDPSHSAVQQPVPAGDYKTRKINIDRDGMNIYGVAHIPSGIEGKLPAVIISHELGATLDRVKGYGEALAKAGYVTVCFDFCGGGWESRSDGAVLDMSVLTEKADLEAVLDEVMQWECVDAGSVYLMGNSQGGYVSTLVAAERPDDVRAMILIYPGYSLYYDVHEMFDSTKEIPDSDYLLGMRLGRSYFEDIWEQEPYQKAQEYGKEILLIHGSRDSVVPLSCSARLADTVDHVEYHVLRGADHGFLGRNFDQAVSYILDFLNRVQGSGSSEGVSK